MDTSYIGNDQADASNGGSSYPLDFDNNAHYMAIHVKTAKVIIDIVTIQGAGVSIEPTRESTVGKGPKIIKMNTN